MEDKYENIEECYPFEMFFHDKRGLSKKEFAHLAWSAIWDLCRTKERMKDIYKYMDDVFSDEWGITDMMPVWKVKDDLKYAIRHAEFNGEFNESDEDYIG